MPRKKFPKICGIKSSTLSEAITALNQLFEALPDILPVDLIVSSLASFGPPMTDFLVAYRKDSALIIHDPQRTYPDEEILKFFMNDAHLRKVFACELNRGKKSIDRDKLREIFKDLFYASSSKPLRKMYPKLSIGYIRKLIAANRKKMADRWMLIQGLVISHCVQDPKIVEELFQKVMNFAFRLKREYCKDEIASLMNLVEEIHHKQRSGVQLQSTEQLKLL